MFSRRRSLFDFSRGRLSKAPRRQKRRSRPSSQRERTRLGVETLESRVLLAVDVFIDPVSGNVTIMDESVFSEAGEVQEDNAVILSVDNMDPDGGQGAGAQDGLLILDAGGVNALSPGLVQVSPTRVFVPQDFDFDPGPGVNLQPVLSDRIMVDLQDGNDTLSYSDSVDSVPVVTTYFIQGGNSDFGGDKVFLRGTAGVAETVVISNNGAPDISTEVNGYAGIRIVSDGNEFIRYSGEGDDDELTVDLGTVDATARVQRGNADGSGEVISNVLPTVHFNDLQTFELEASGARTEATFSLAGLIGADNYRFESVNLPHGDTLIIEGTPDGDAARARLNGGELEVTLGGRSLTTLGMDSEDLLRVETLGGDDMLTVDVAGGLIPTPIYYDGGVGSDLLVVSGDSGDAVTNTYTPGIQPDEGRLEYSGVTTRQIIDFDNLEPVIDLVVSGTLFVHANDDDNQITFGEGPNTFGPAVGGVSSGLISIDGFETIEFANKQNLDLFAGAGADTIVTTTNALPTLLETFEILGEAGADTIQFDDLSAGFSSVTARGGSGNDVIDASNLGAFATSTLFLLGDAGADTITGGPANDLVEGGSGDDTFIDSPGDDQYQDGNGFDTLVFRGTGGADVIDVIQQASADPPLTDYQITLNTDLNPAPESTETITNAIGTNVPTIDLIRIEGLSGDDIIRAGHADSYNDPTNVENFPDQTIAFEIVGDSPNASDRLIVPDLGAGDLVIQREGPDDRSGSITVGGNAPIDYSETEFVNVTPLDPITGGTGDDGLGRLVVFKHDPFESNNTLPNATFLGSGPTVNVDPTIDPAGIPAFGIPGDNDFYQFVAQETGTLDVQLYFEPIATLANGRLGLPVDGELFVTVLDSDGIGVIPTPTASDLLDPVGNKIGERITVPVVRNNTYYLRVQGEQGDDVTGINVYNFTAINTPAPIPQLVDLFDDTDSGRNNTDDITFFDANVNGAAVFDIVLDDARIDEFVNLDLTPDNVNDDAATADFDYGVEVFNNAESIGFAYLLADSTWRFTATAGDLQEGDFNHISAAVWIRDAAMPEQLGRHELSAALQVELDTIEPPVQFGVPANLDGLIDSSDSGVLTDPATFGDRVTSDTTPGLVGTAEANSIVRVYADLNNNDVLDINDQLVGQTTAIPIDGNLAEPDGFWELESVADLNELFGVRDGFRRLFVTAEDVAGNVNGILPDEAFQRLELFIDTQGPQIYDPAGPTQAVHPAGFPEYDLFDPKPSENGHTPLTRQITINVRDLPVRSNEDPNFLYEALQEEIAEIVGNYSLVGDHVGQIGIQSVVVTNAVVINGQQATATIDLVFADFLPDDRFTLTISDNLVDPAGNNLDGESNADQPLDNPVFPSGDGIPGGDFVARFTIDSRPEIGSYVSQNIDIDINGNFVWDPSNDQIGNDATNVDLTFTLGVANANGTVGLGRFGTHDLAFAGKFTTVDANIAMGAGEERVEAGVAPPPIFLFDQLAAYGWSSELNARRWIIDTNSDGVVTLGTDILTLQPDIAGFNVAGALPVAGNFDGDATNGDEIGLYFAGQWAFDTDRDFVIEPAEVIGNNGLLGHPIVGDFDGDGLDDAAVFNNNVFTFDLANDGFNGADANLVWGFPGVLDRPVAADMDQDGVDDIGLWVPRNSAQDNRPVAEWYFLISDLPSNVVPLPGTISALNHPFEPVPFGADIYAEFGDELALPLVGNFDPPVTPESIVDQGGPETGDFNQDGDVDGSDFLAFQRGYGMTSGARMSDGDGNGDGAVDHADMELWSSAYQTEAATAPEFNAGGSLDAWQVSYGQSTVPGTFGDANGDGFVSGSDFLQWQRGQTTAAAATVAASTSSEILVAAASAAPTFDRAGVATVLRQQYAPAAREAAFESLEDSAFADFDVNEGSALALSVPAESTNVGDSDSSVDSADDREALDAALSDDDALLSSLL